MGKEPLNMPPYRELATVEKYELEKLKEDLDLFDLAMKPKYGRLPYPTQAPLHKCILPKPPGFFARLFGEKFEFQIGDLYRCECGSVYRYTPFSVSNREAFRKSDEFTVKTQECGHKSCRSLCEWWSYSSIKEWKASGGEE
jgi:hypothetical protein